MFCFQSFHIPQHTHFSSPSKHYRLGGSPTLAELGGVTGPSLLWGSDFELYWFSIDLYHLFLSLVLTLMEISKCLHSNFGPVFYFPVAFVHCVCLASLWKQWQCNGKVKPKQWGSLLSSITEWISFALLYKDWMRLN